MVPGLVKLNFPVTLAAIMARATGSRSVSTVTEFCEIQQGTSKDWSTC
jgi:hypothetical protein